jgi:hypothetical protein
MRDSCPLYHRKQTLIARAPMPAKRVGIEEHAMEKSSPVFFESMAVAAKEGKKALTHLLAKAKHAA